MTGNIPDSRQRRPDTSDKPPEAAGNGPLAECVRLSQQLLDAILNESVILKRFDSRQLLELIPQKEVLARSFHDRLSVLFAEDGAEELKREAAYATLKQNLHEITRLNDANRVFIQCSLGHFKAFMECIHPSAYGPVGRYAPAPVKGLSLRKEI